MRKFDNVPFEILEDKEVLQLLLLRNEVVSEDNTTKVQIDDLIEKI